MGEVYEPEDIALRRKKPIPDLTPKPIPQPATRANLESIIQEIESIKTEILKLKESLRSHGIIIE